VYGERKHDEYELQRAHALVIIGALTFVPGSYVLFVAVQVIHDIASVLSSVQSWRGKPGYRLEEVVQ
jgi:hypothetical protein